MYKMKELEYGQKVRINGKRGTVFTVRGYAIKNGQTPEKEYNRAIKNGHNLFAVLQEPAILSGDPGFYDREMEKWADATTIYNGEIVNIEGEVLETIYKGNYSDMVHFRKLF